MTKLCYIFYIYVAIIRDSFLKALSHKQPNMETLRITLSTLVHHTDELINNNRQLRSKTSNEVCFNIYYSFRYKFIVLNHQNI